MEQNSKRHQFQCEKSKRCTFQEGGRDSSVKVFSRRRKTASKVLEVVMELC